MFPDQIVDIQHEEDFYLILLLLNIDKNHPGNFPDNYIAHHKLIKQRKKTTYNDFLRSKTYPFEYMFHHSDNYSIDKKLLFDNLYWYNLVDIHKYNLN